MGKLMRIDGTDVPAGWGRLLQARDRNFRVASHRSIFWKPRALDARRRAEALHEAFVRRYDLVARTWD